MSSKVAIPRPDVSRRYASSNRRISSNCPCRRRQAARAARMRTSSKSPCTYAFAFVPSGASRVSLSSRVNLFGERPNCTGASASSPALANARNFSAVKSESKEKAYAYAEKLSAGDKVYVVYFEDFQGQTPVVFTKDKYSLPG